MKISREFSPEKTLLLALIAFLVSVLVSCGKSMMTDMNPPPAVANPSFAFVANVGSNSISAFEIVPSTGALAPVEGSPFPAGSGPEFLAVNASGTLLFAANTGSHNISAFQINSTTGALTPAPGSPFATGTTPEGLAVISSSNLLFVADSGGNEISSFQFDASSGALTPLAEVSLQGSPFSLTADPLGKFLFATDPNDDQVFGFSINSMTGDLTPVAGSPFAGGFTPIGMTADPNGLFIYVGDHMGNEVVGFNLNSTTGALTPETPVPAATSCNVSCHVNPLRVAVHPTARLALVADVGANTLSAFSLANGMLSPMSSPATTGQHPFGVAFDPTGSFVYVVNKVDNDISGFAVNTTTGALTSLSGAGSPFAAGTGTTGIVVVSPQ
jgi:6-phosphogluconolactonase